MAREVVKAQASTKNFLFIIESNFELKVPRVPSRASRDFRITVESD